VAIIGPPTRDDADVDYTFGPVRVNEARVDFRGNCGNISAGIGPFAIEEGFVAARGAVAKVAASQLSDRIQRKPKVPSTTIL
jgi:2-methylaconitate cis-trans-isomerase PrpF